MTTSHTGVLIVDLLRPECTLQQLKTALTDGPWYADFGNATSHTVVLPGRVFTYAAGDSAGRRVAYEHGLSSGIPEHQLDWTT
jgi:hypothetical protein